MQQNKENDHRGNEKFYEKKTEDVLRELEADLENGLSHDDVVTRQEKYGLNQLEEEKHRHTLLVLLDQFKSIVIVIMAIACVVAFATARIPEGVALIAVILVNTAIGFFTEWKAIRSMEALRALGRKTAYVRRDGRQKEVAVEQLVPGDIVLLRQEELVPADVRIVVCEDIRVNEAALTGESMPINKSSESVEENAPLHARTSMLYKGTSIAEGAAEGVVTATGFATEIGRISKLVAEAEETTAPLQIRLDHLARKLAWITIAVAVMVGAAGLAVGRETLIMIETAIALGVAAIPEGLPIVATIALARGMWLMAQRNALINRLTAVETLGATSVIFTDKTGTLTENRMTVVAVITADASYAVGEQDGDDASAEATGLWEATEESSINRLLRIGMLCSNVREKGQGDGFSGDPTEVALLEAAVEAKLDRHRLLEEMPEVREVPFDSETMMMATFHRLPDEDNGDGNYYIAVKGAPGKILDVCSKVWQKDRAVLLEAEQRRKWHERVEKSAVKGLRLLAFADKETGNSEVDAYNNLRFVGLVGLEDPPRSDVKEAIQECRNAGIRVVMVTGDRPDTSASIGKQVGLVDDENPFHGSDLSKPDELSEEDRKKVLEAGLFARVTPEQKYNLVKQYQSAGHICAMTGDGVNDTPALKQADIGIAMGRGTDAARQVADMVLRDDKFPTIVEAVREGRIIFANIRKSVMFMLCTNIAEVLTVTLASLAQAPLPLKPLQILFLNVLTDVFPALALAVGAGAVDVMKRPPRAAEEAVLTGHHWRWIGGWSIFIGAIVLGALALALLQFGFEERHAVTISFLTLAFTKLWFVLNLRDRGTALWSNDILKNPWVWAAWGLCLSLLFTAVYWQPLASVLQIVPPGMKGWSLILAMSVLPVILGAFLPGIRFYSTKR